jgi:hypothetical protein
LKQGGALKIKRALRGWGTGGIFFSFCASLFNDTYRMSLISAGSFSLDSTFKAQPYVIGLAASVKRYGAQME